MKTKTITVSKSRKIQNKRRECWVKAEVTVEFDTEPTLENIDELNDDLEEILRREEQRERDYWDRNISTIKGTE